MRGIKDTNLFNSALLEPKQSFDGKDTFAFAYSSDKKMVVPIYTTLDEDTLKQSCYNNSAASRHGCAALIQANGWEIPDDYPWIR